MRSMTTMLMMVGCSVVFLVGCVPSSQTDPRDTESTGQVGALTTLSGTVYRQTYPLVTDSGQTSAGVAGETDRAALPGVIVTVSGVSTDGDRNTLATATTNEDGSYSLTVRCVSSLRLDVAPPDGQRVLGVTWQSDEIKPNCGLADAGEVDLFIGPSSASEDRVVPSGW